MAILYVKSIPGILKIVEEVLNLIAFSCVADALSSSRGDAFLAASVGAFIITFLLLMIRMFDLDQKIVAPWHMIEMGYCAVWSVFYLITAALVLDFGTPIRGTSLGDKYLAGGSFGIFAIMVYIADAYDKFRSKP